MPSARGIRAGAAYVELFANDNQLVRGLKRAQARLKAFGMAVREIGMSMVKLSAVFSTPFIAGAKVFADFEQQMAAVATMLDEPEKHMERFNKGIRDMSVEFGESTETLAGGLYDILSASIPAEKALDVLAVAARAAKAGLSDTKTAADAITTVLNAYSLSADHAAEVSDLLFSIVKRGKTTFGELAPNIGKVATLAGTAGLSLEELGSTIAVLTRNGVKTEQAMSAVAAVISTFLKPSAEGAEAARELGFELNSATLQSEGLRGVLERLSSLPPDALAQIFPNVEALRGLLPALKDMDGFAQDMEAMGSRAGATGKAYKTMTSTLTQSFQQLKQSALATLSVIGEALAKPLAEIADKIRQWVEKVREFLKENPGFVVAVAKIVAIVGAVGAALVALGIAASVMGSIFGGVATVLSMVGGVLGTIISIIGAILTPLGLVITSVAALGTYLLWTSGEGGKALSWLGEVFGDLKNDATAAWGGISDALAAGDIGLAAKILWLTLKMEWTKGINFLEKAWLNFRNFFIKIGYDAWHGLLAEAEIVWHALEVGWIETTAFLSQAWTFWTGAVVNAWYWVSKQLVKTWNWVKGQFDSDFDVEAANRMADKYYDTQMAQNIEETWNKLADREDERMAERERAARDHEATMAEIGQENLDKHKQLDDEYKQRMDENEAELAKARKEWEDSIFAAKDKLAKKLPKGENRTPGQPDTHVNLPSFDGISTAIETAVQKIKADVIGTFSAASVNLMGYGASTAERTAQASEETAKNTKKIVQKMDDTELVFS